MRSERPDQAPGEEPPPRAFSQGLGLVFQVVGVMLFIVLMFLCCGSSLLSRDWATNTELTTIGWHLPGDPAAEPTYSAQKAMTISLFTGLVLGLSLAGIGLGLQSEHRASAAMALTVTAAGAVFWSVHMIFAAQLHSVLFTIVAGMLALICLVLLIFSISAVGEMRRNPPPPGHELLPKEYKVPYSHYHQDPPEVRLARELEERRQRLAVQQKELEALEEKIRRQREDQSSAPK